MKRRAPVMLNNKQIVLIPDDRHVLVSSVSSPFLSCPAVTESLQMSQEMSDGEFPQLYPVKSRSNYIKSEE